MRPSHWLILCIPALVQGRAVHAVSTDGICGANTGHRCMNSIFGNCCGPDGTCGATAEHCGSGCQLAFGICEATEFTPSQDGTCGGALRYSCVGSEYGDCCSEFGYCGASEEYCGTGCRSDFGKCTNALQARQPSLVDRSSTFFSPAPASYGPPSRRQDNCIRCEGQPGHDQFCGFDINTDYHQYTPKTCRTVEYTLEIRNTTLAPDGIPRIALTVNGQMPGPTIEANWGDTVKVNVINKLTDNGTTIHFHGVRMRNANQYDGVPSITQCPIPPGESMTYTWVAESYGSSWYHSHFAIQAWEGVFGPVVIHGPSSYERKYDYDVGHIMLQDWSHWTVDSQYHLAQDATPGHDGGVRVMDNGLINGKNTWGRDGAYNQTGERFKLKVTQGKSYKLRLINVSIQSTFKFQIDGHTLKVIAADFIPIIPYETKIININIGERYDVIVVADQPIDDYWLRSDNQHTCSGVTQGLDIKGIWSYEGAPGANPTSLPLPYVTECTDEDHTLHTPILEFDVDKPDITWFGDVTVGFTNNLFTWVISGSSFSAKWADPTVRGILDNGTAPTYSGDLVINAPKEGEWVYVVVESALALPHPLHLHGHDFFILATGQGRYDASVPLRLKNPSRRDTVLMPGKGFIVVAWKVDNPGAWLMHCHVGWHSAMGFAAQVIEIQDRINSTWNDGGRELRDMCSAWSAWAKSRDLNADDAGV